MAANGNSSILGFRHQPCCRHRHGAVGAVPSSAWPGGPHFLWDPSGLKGMDWSLTSLPRPTPAWDRPWEEKGGRSICSDSEQSWEASVNSGKPLGTGQSYPWAATRPGKRLVTWAENEGSEKCLRAGVSPDSRLPSREGEALFSLRHSHLILLGSAGRGMGRELGNKHCRASQQPACRDALSCIQM